MIDVNGVYFEPRQKVTELTHTAIYEGHDGYRYIVKRDTRTRTQAIIRLEQEREKTGLSMRKFGLSIGVPSTTYIRWQGKGRVANNETGIKAVMEVLGVSESVAIELIEEV
ncbi:hypothetical protein [Jeotgalibaca porci]|uniref:hypothetical protein n=1 Tax=Jeotgalibaca porci TaxID=1868793 RepID=UPI00359F2761